MPSFGGFQLQGDALVAMVVRTPLLSSTPCVNFKGRDFDIQLDIRSIPDSATRIILGGEACTRNDSVCSSLNYPMPFAAPTVPLQPSG